MAWHGGPGWGTAQEARGGEGKGRGGEGRACLTGNLMAGRGACVHDSPRAQLHMHGCSCTIPNPLPALLPSQPGAPHCCPQERSPSSTTGYTACSHQSINLVVNQSLAIKLKDYFGNQLIGLCHLFKKNTENDLTVSSNCLMS